LTSDSSAASGNASYKYTLLNQVCYAGSSNTTGCSSPPSGSIPYAYDAADNLTQKGTFQQAFNNADELCWTASTSSACSTPPSGATTYQYDNRGNRSGVTSSGGQARTLTYNQANRMTKYVAASTTSYGYNADGLRMCKLSGSSTQPCQANGNTPYVWDVAGLLPRLLKDGATAYIYGPGNLPLEQVNGSTANWFHHDQLGSTRLVTDSSGAAQASYIFDSYGSLISSTGSITNPLLFAGQYQDPESGLYYLRARYYDPATGQFTSIDPVVQTTRQPYAYVAGNPLNAIDPRGLQGSTRGHTPPPCAKSPRGCEIFGGQLRRFGEWIGQNARPIFDAALFAWQGCQQWMEWSKGTFPVNPGLQTLANVGACITGAIASQFGVDPGDPIKKHT
jgi:RHS repeat-associated protein